MNKFFQKFFGEHLNKNLFRICLFKDSGKTAFGIQYYSQVAISDGIVYRKIVCCHIICFFFYEN